ncbi:hypothetical protein EPYR_03774 [Erwinia pyrifoliae DSM 12163]|nr:hypothetical protein EPYR_03774 [Erwinia pyrifoliae DSM 12163]
MLAPLLYKTHYPLKGCRRMVQTSSSLWMKGLGYRGIPQK